MKKRISQEIRGKGNYTAHSSIIFSAVISDKCFFRATSACRREKISNEIQAAAQKINKLIH